MDIFDKLNARKPAAPKIVKRTAYTVHVNGRDLASRIVSRAKAAKIARRMRKSGFAASARLFGKVNLKETELPRFN